MAEFTLGVGELIQLAELNQAVNESTTLETQLRGLHSVIKDGSLRYTNRELLKRLLEHLRNDGYLVLINPTSELYKTTGTYGVEPVCRVLQIVPSGYRRHAAQQRSPELRCARVKRDASLLPQIHQVWQNNMQVYGADKVWHQLNREGVSVARCTVERLMRLSGLRGVRRGKVVRTTIGDRSMPCPLDRVNRQFKADRPNQLWVSDFTYVSTWQGW